MVPAMDRPPDPDLPAIPVIEVGAGGALALFQANPERAARLLAIGRDTYPTALVGVGEGLSRRWLARNANPYLPEIDAIDAALSGAGTYFLNVSYEWGCTVGLTAAPLGSDTSEACGRLVRTLDWRFDGLGAEIVAARFEAPAGPWINLTWPGFVGCVQAMAPGRFAACFNQAPFAARSGLFPLDWLAERTTVWRSAALPPAHLLRQVFESCPDYEAARASLIETPVAAPAIFSLSGRRPDQGCVIERLTDRAFVHEAPIAVTNHWLTSGLRGYSRGIESGRRQTLMTAGLADAGPDFAWLQPPILNETTRLAMVADAAAGRLWAVGYEAQRPVTRPLVLDAANGARRRSA